MVATLRNSKIRSNEFGSFHTRANSGKEILFTIYQRLTYLTAYGCVQRCERH